MKISSTQIFWLLIAFITGRMLLLSISYTIKFAKNDAWISYLIAIVIGILITYIASKVALLYPKMTFVDYCRSILGKILGTIIILSYVVQWLLSLGNILGAFYEFGSTILLPTTPSWVFLLSMLFLALYVNIIGGIEGIGRTSEVFGPLIILIMIILSTMTMPNLEYSRILPVLADTDFISLIKGSLFSSSLLGESIVLLILLTFVDQPQKAIQRAIWAIIITSIIVIITAIGVILTFGSYLPTILRNPAFDMIGFVNAMHFIQNLEIIAVLVWMLSVFIKVSIYMFVSSHVLAQLFKIKQWQKVTLFVAGTSFVLAIIFIKYFLHGYVFINTFWMPFVFPVNMIALPILLLIIGSIRKKMEQKKSPSY